MSKTKLLKKILAGSKNIRFEEMVALARSIWISVSASEWESSHFHSPGSG